MAWCVLMTGLLTAALPVQAQVVEDAPKETPQAKVYDNVNTAAEMTVDRATSPSFKDVMKSIPGIGAVVQSMDAVQGVAGDYINLNVAKGVASDLFVGSNGSDESFTSMAIKDSKQKNSIKNIQDSFTVAKYKKNVAQVIYIRAIKNGKSEDEAKELEERAIKAIDDSIANTYSSYLEGNSDEDIKAAAEKTKAQMEKKLEDYYARVKEGQTAGLSEAEAVEQAANPELANLDMSETKCATIEQLKARYQSGCWSCLVIEKLSSSFLKVASLAYTLSQKGGLIVLGIGSVLWLLLWGLKNLSSVTQLNAGNMLNDLMKFAFKVMVAYLFITNGLKVISTYFLNPIMGTGAVIAQQFWPDNIASQIENYVWEDEVVTPAQKAVLEQEIAASNEKAATARKKVTTTEVTKTETKPLPQQTAQKTTAAPAQQAVAPLKISTPQIIDSSASPHEAVVQQFQKALVQLLNQRYATIKASCVNGNCSKDCRFSSCSDPGHRQAVKDIFTSAGQNGMYGAYCQASITAALEDLNRMVGGNIANFQTGTVNCLGAINNAAKNYPGSVTASPSGGDVPLKEALKYANIGDMVYMRVGDTTASGYHAMTYIGGGRVISFNGDSIFTITNQTGKIVSTSEIIRQKIAKNPNALKNVNMDKLNQLAAGSGLMTLVNYQSGTYQATTTSTSYSTSAQTYRSGGDVAANYGAADFNSLIIPVADVTYSGPNDIISKSVMNSILGAVRVITNTTAENMVLGNAITCYSTLDKGGAWHLAKGWWINLYITNVIMWIEGALIWCAGFMLTMSVAYYLIDITFKIGFAVIALPLVAGLWPFNMTKGKFTMCLSIIMKSAATFAFLAITCSYAMSLIDVSLTGGTGGDGLNQIYEAMDTANNGIKNEESIQYVAEKLAVFSFSFIILLFAFIYSYKLIGATVPQFVNKFFPDKTFGDTQPMHHWATGTTKAVKDLAMKPVGLVRDIALHQGGRAAKGLIGGTVNLIRGKTIRGSKAKEAAKKEQKENDHDE